MSNAEPFNTLGGYSVGIPPQLVIDDSGNVVTNVNAPNSNVTANRVFANSYLYANGDPLSIGASGSNTQVQYNNNGLLGASSAFTFNSSTSLLTVSKLQASNSANLGNVSNVIILGGTNGYFLQTDGTGNLTWAPAGNGGSGGNGSPAGANTQVQYNNAGNFGGDSGFTYNSTTNLLTVGNISTGNITANYIVTNWDVTANVVVANYLYGDGSNISNVVAVSAATANTVAGANVTGQVGFAAVANSVAGANVTGQVGFANVANHVAGANITGQVANALVAGTVYTSAQPNITSVGNLTALTVTGNTTLGNQVVSNYFIGNLFGTANLARYVTFASQPNITSVGTLTSLTVSGNTTLGNATTSNYFVGNLHGVANSATVANLANLATHANTANFANTAALANNTLYSNTANIANIAYSVDAANIVGQVANALVAATVYTNAQPNITSVGTLTSLNVAGNVTSGNIFANSGIVKANYFIGQLATGTQPNITGVGTLSNLNITGNITNANWINASYFAGNGSALFGITAANIVGLVANASFADNAGNATISNTANYAILANTVIASSQPNITSLGTLTNLAIAGNITSANRINANSFAGNGDALFGIKAANITGVVANANYAANAGHATTATNAASATVAGSVTTGAQPNITSLGTLSSLGVNGNVTATNITANTGVFTGNANGLYGIRAANIVGIVANANYSAFAGNATVATNATSANTAGTVTTAAQPNITSLGTLSSLGVNGNVTATNITANTGVFTGNANGLYNIPAANINGVVANATYAANSGFATNANSATFALTAGTVTTAAQPNITSLGNLNSLSVNGVSNLGNVENVRILGGSTNYVLRTDGTGNLSWVAQSGGGGNANPGGSNTYIQYNDNGLFAGSSNFTWNNVTGLLFINGHANANGNITAKTFVSNVANGTAPLVVVSTTPVANLGAETAGTVRNAAQPNITSVGTLSTLAVTGNISAGNVQGGNLVSANFVSGTLTTNAQPNVTSLGTLTGLLVNGNITAANITANTGVFAGNGSGLTNIAGGNVVGAVANATYAVTAGSANTATNASSATTAVNVTGNAQPNITSVGTLTQLNVTGNVLAGNLNANNVVLASNGAFFGNGAGLSNINAANITSGILPSGRLNGAYDISVTTANTAATVTNGSQPNITSVGTLTGLGVNGNVTAQNIIANTGVFVGNANGLTNIPGANVTGTVANASYALSANSANTATLATSALTASTVTGNAQPNITSVGNLSHLNVSGNVLAGNLNANNVVLSSNGAFYGNATGLTSINAANITTGILPSGRLNGSYDISVTFANTSNTVTQSNQPNITSLGTLTSLAVNGTANLGTVSNVKISGGINGYVLQTDGTGNLSWTAQTGGNGNGSPGGATTQIQYNQDGNFAGSPNLSWTNNTNYLYVGGNATITGYVNVTVLTSNVSTGTAPFIVTSTTPVANLGVATADTVRNNAQPNITSVGTLTGLTVSGNIISNNLTVNASFTTNGNVITPLNVFANNGIVRGNLLTGTLTSSAQPNITSVGTLSTLAVTGNVSAGNINGGNLVSANFISGTLTTNAQANINYLGNVGWLNVDTTIPNANGNITFNGSMSGIGGSSNIHITGNLQAGNFVSANHLVGTITTNAQPSITSLGTLTGLNVNGISNLGSAGNVKITGGTNGYVLSTDGTGNLSWVAQSANGGNGVPGGSNTQIQFNNNGSFGGSADFTFNDVTNQFTVGGNANFVGKVTANTFTSTATTGTAPFIVNSTTPVANLAVATAGTVRDNVQPNITGLGILTGLTVNGAVTVNSLTVDNNFSVSGNITTQSNIFANNGTVRGNLLTGTLTTALQPNITSVGTLANLTVAGNIGAGNVNGGNLIAANFVTGTLTTNLQPNINVVGNLGWLNVDTTVANGNGNIRFNGSMVGTGAASNITITGNVNAGNFVQAELLIGTLTTSSQPNITTLGNLSSLTVLGNSNLGSASNIKITGGVANYVLSTDGLGNLSWVAQSGGGGNATPGGPNTSLQFNDGGTLGGVSNLLYNKGTSNLLLTGNANITGLLTAQSIRSTVATGSAPFQVNSTTPVANLAVETAATVRNSAQPNITSLGILTSLEVLGNTQTSNLTVTNLLTANTISSPGTIGTTNLNVTGNAALTGNATIQNATANKLTVTGNINANSSPNVTLGNISNLHIFGGINGYYLQTDGAGNLTWAPGGGGGGNGVPGGSNTQVQFNDQGEFGGAAGFTFNKISNVLSVNSLVVSSTITSNSITANTLSGDGTNITNVSAIIANVANSVAGANVTGQVNFAAVANSVAGANVTGQVSFANVANSVAGANVSGEVAFANVANSVAGANVIGVVANANYAANAGFANTAITATSANTAITVTGNNQPNITSVGTLTVLDVTGNVVGGNLYANAGTVRGNLVGGNFLLGTLITGSQPNITTVGSLSSLTVLGITNLTDVNANGNAVISNLSANVANISNLSANNAGLSNLTVSGNALVSGNLTVNGNLIYINVETLAVEDPIIELQIGPNGTPPVSNSGKDVGTALNYFDTDARKGFMGWDVSGQEFIMAARTEINNEVVTVLQFGNLHIGNIIGNGQALTGLNAANIVGTIPYANSANTANTVIANAQPNITSVGILTSLNVSGNIAAGNASLGNAVVANYFVGSGEFITGNVGNANYAAYAGNITTANQPNITSLGNLTSLTVTGNSSLGSNANVKISGGALGQVLGTDGNGNLSWLSASGVPGGANRAIQYNDNGVFGGDAFLTYNETTQTLQISGNLVANTIQMGAGAYDFSVSNVYFATTNSITPNQTILAIPVSGIAAVDYTIISTDGAIRNFVKISVVRSGTTVNYVEYSSLPVNGYTGDFTVAYSAGNIITPASIVLKFSPQTANLMTHKMMITTYKE